MELKEAIISRCSIREFSEDLIKEEDLLEIARLSMKAPSAVNKRPWELYIYTKVEDLDILRGLTARSNYNAKAAIIVAGNKNRFLEGEGEGYWVEDTSAVTENILLLSRDKGIGTVWIGLYPVKARMNYIIDNLKFDDNIIPFSLILLGYPKNGFNPRDIDETEKIHLIK